MTEYIEALPDSDRAEVNEQMLRLTTSTELAHLREISESESPVDVPGAIPEPSPEDAAPPARRASAASRAPRYATTPSKWSEQDHARQ